MRYLKLLIPLITCFFVFTLSVFSASASEFNFNVSTELPDNQVDSNVTYFDLKVTPGQEQTIYIKVTNSSNKKITVLPKINEAKTNKNGSIQYDTNSIETDKLLKKNIVDYVDVQKSIDVPANSSVALPIKLTIPKKGFDGILLGGIELKQKNSKEDDSDSSNEKNTGFENQYAYIIGLRLHENEKKIVPELKLNDIKIKQDNSRNVVMANIQNTQPTTVKNMAVNAIVYYNDKEIRTYKQKKVQMAPISNFDFTIPLEDFDLKDGKYRVDLEVSTDDKKWKFSDSTTINDKLAEKYNESNVSNKTGNYNWIYIVVGGLLVISSVGYLYYRKKMM